MQTALAGILIGVPPALVVSQLVNAHRFGIGRTYPVTFAAVLVLPRAVTLVAAWPSARRAGAVDPLTTLRR